MDLYDELKGLIERLDTGGIPYALCGGLAVAVHGLVRATVDIDIMIEPGTLDHAKELAISAGFTHDAGLMKFSQSRVLIYRLTKVDPDAGDLLTVDWLLVTPYLKSVWKTRMREKTEFGEISVLSRQGLIKMKSLRNSGKDRDDIRFLKGQDDGS